MLEDEMDTIHVPNRFLYQLLFRQKIYQRVKINEFLPLHFRLLNEPLLDNILKIQIQEDEKIRQDNYSRIFTKYLTKKANLKRREKNIEYLSQFTNQSTTETGEVDFKSIAFNILTDDENVSKQFNNVEDYKNDKLFPIVEYFNIVDVLINDKNEDLLFDRNSLIEDIKSEFEIDFNLTAVKKQLESIVDVLQNFVDNNVIFEIFEQKKQQELILPIDIEEVLRQIDDFDIEKVIRKYFFPLIQVLLEMANKLAFLNNLEQDIARMRQTDEFTMSEYLKYILRNIKPLLDESRSKEFRDAVKPFIKYLDINKPETEITIQDLLEYTAGLKNIEFIDREFKKISLEETVFKEEIVERKFKYATNEMLPSEMLPTELNPTFQNLQNLKIALFNLIAFLLAESTFFKPTYEIQNNLRGKNFSNYEKDKYEIEQIVNIEEREDSTTNLNTANSKFYNNREKYVDFTRNILQFLDDELQMKPENNEESEKYNDLTSTKLFINKYTSTRSMAQFKKEKTVKKLADVELLSENRYKKLYNFKNINDKNFRKKITLLIAQLWFDSDFLFLDYLNNEFYKELDIDNLTLNKKRFKNVNSLDLKLNFKEWFESLTIESTRNRQKITFKPKVFIKSVQTKKVDENTTTILTEFLFKNSIEKMITFENEAERIPLFFVQFNSEIGEIFEE